MKSILYFFMIIFFSTNVYARGAKLKKEFKAPEYSKVLCQQKYIPMTVEQTLNSHLLSVSFTAQRKIDQFKILNVRGLEGVSIMKFQEQNVSDIQSGDVLTSDVELSPYNGLVYVVFDVSIKVDGVLASHSIPVPVGTLSAVQIKERSKNITEVKSDIQTKEGTSAINAAPKKLHEMQAD